MTINSSPSNGLKKWQTELEIMEETFKVESGENSIRLICLLYEVGLIYGQDGDHQFAASRLQRALELWQHEGLELDLLFVLINNSLGHSLQALGRTGDATLSFTVALQTLCGLCGETEKLPEGLTLSVLFHRLGKGFHSFGLLKEAETSYNLALKASKAGVNYEQPGVAAKVLNDYGVMKIAQLKYREAIKLFNTAHTILIEHGGGSSEPLGEVLTNLGAAFDCACQYSLAIENYATAYAFYEGIGNVLEAALVLRNMGMSYEAIGQFQLSEDTYFRAMAMCRKLPNCSLYLLSSIAHSYARRRMYETAIWFLQASILEQQSNGQTEVVLGNDINSLGCCFAGMGRYAEACQKCNMALTIFVSEYGSRHVSVSRVLNDIGNIYFIIGNYDLALHYFIAAFKTNMELSQDNKSYERMADNANNIGLAFLFLRRLQESIQIFKASISIFEELYGCGHVKAADTINNLGAAFCHTGNHEGGIEQFERALELYRTAFGESYLGSAEVRTDLGLAYSLQNRYTEAIPLLQSVYDIYNQHFGPGNISSCEALYDLVTVYFRANAIALSSKSAKKLQEIWETHYPSNLETERGKWITDLAKLT